MRVPSDIEIAQSCAMRPITEIAAAAGVDPQYLELYGSCKAKVDPRLLRESRRGDGKLILVTAINPTPAGEGKTTTTVGLAGALRRLDHDVLDSAEHLRIQAKKLDAVTVVLLGIPLAPRHHAGHRTEAFLHKILIGEGNGLVFLVNGGTLNTGPALADVNNETVLGIGRRRILVKIT